MDTIDIGRILPHRGRMKLIDEVIEVGDNHAITASTASDQWPLYSDGYIHALIIIELGAQTAGVIFGWEHLQQNDPSAGEKGWIAGIKMAEFNREQIPLGERIIIQADRQNSLGGYAEVTGSAMINSEVIGTFTIQLFRPEFGKPEEKSYE